MKIKKLIAFIAEKDNHEKLICLNDNGKVVPAVTEDEQVALTIEKILSEVAVENKETIKMVEFTKFKTIKYL